MDKDSKKQEPWNKGKTGVKRATKKVVAYRVHKAARMMAQGASQADVVAYAVQEWGLSKSQGKRIFREALTEVKETWEINREEFAALLLAQLNDLHKKTSSRQNDSVTLGCINSAAKIAGIFGGFTG